MSGAEALWSSGSVSQMGLYGGRDTAGRMDAEVGYGLRLGSRLVGTPRAGFGTSALGRLYRAGYGVGVLGDEALSFERGVDVQREERPMQGGVSRGFSGVRRAGRLRW